MVVILVGARAFVEADCGGGWPEPSTLKQRELGNPICRIMRGHSLRWVLMLGPTLSRLEAEVEVP